MANISYPNHPEKYSKSALFSPKDYLQYFKKHHQLDYSLVPESAVIVFLPGLYKKIKQTYRTQRLGNVLEVAEIDKKKIGISRVPGIGAPAAAVVLEEMIGLGVRQFAVIGTAGGLQKSLKIGDFVVCERAIRDEGTSYHYLEPSKYIESSPLLTRKLVGFLKQQEHKFQVGTSWTVDTPYRETTAEVIQYQSEGVLTVEMEAAALFSVAKFRNVSITAAFTISDSLADLKWNPQFFSSKLNSQLDLLFQASVCTLLNE